VTRTAEFIIHESRHGNPGGAVLFFWRRPCDLQLRGGFSTSEEAYDRAVEVLLAPRK